MKLRYFSDLHLEFLTEHESNLLIQKIYPGINDICILAGDIGNPYSANYNTFMEFISRNFKKTFVIAGNHEYYNDTKTVEETKQYMKNYFERFSNISFLDNQFEVYNNVCFIGTTLWSKISNPNYKINDVTQIPHFDCDKYNQLHESCVQFLEKTVPFHDHCVVITHHLPSDSLTNAKYKHVMLLPYNQWFSCELMDFIQKYNSKIKCWVYGHTHTPSTKRIGNVPFVCNPMGYPNENNHYDFDIVQHI